MYGTINSLHSISEGEKVYAVIMDNISILKAR